MDKNKFKHTDSSLCATNRPEECALLLDKLNKAIDLFCDLQDSYYTDYIFNQSSDVTEWLEEEGFTENYFSELADKFVKLRAVLYSDNIDYNHLAYELMIKATEHANDWLDRKDNLIAELKRENKALKQKLGEEDDD